MKLGNNSVSELVCVCVVLVICTDEADIFYDNWQNS